MSVDRGRPAPRRASNPRFWAKLTVPIGTLVQLTGLVIGIGLIALAGTFRDWTALAPIMMVLGFVLIYLCCHAVAHFFVGRMVGLRFAYIGVRGTDHPESYPPGLRQLMSVVPMFKTVSTKEVASVPARGASPATTLQARPQPLSALSPRLALRCCSDPGIAIPVCDCRCVGCDIHGRYRTDFEG